VHDLEKAKRLLDLKVAEQQTHIEELEDELQMAEDAKLRLEVNMQALRAQHDRDLQARDQQAEEVRRTFLRQVRDLEGELEDERKQRSAALTARKKIEGDYNELQLSLAKVSQQRDEFDKKSKRLQIQMKEASKESEETRVAKDNLMRALKDKEDLCMQLSAKLNAIQEELMNCERERRYSNQIINLIGDYVNEHRERTGGDVVAAE
jgi:myosin protein heavy chain